MFINREQITGGLRSGPIDLPITNWCSFP